MTTRVEWYGVDARKKRCQEMCKRQLPRVFREALALTLRNVPASLKTPIQTTPRTTRTSAQRVCDTFSHRYTIHLLELLISRRTFQAVHVQHRPQPPGQSTTFASEPIHDGLRATFGAKAEQQRQAGAARRGGSGKGMPPSQVRDIFTTLTDSM